MNFFTLQALLNAEETTRRFFWKLSLYHASLVGELIEQVPLREQFASWQRRESVPRKDLESMYEAIAFNRLVGELLKTHIWGSFHKIDTLPKRWFWWRFLNSNQISSFFEELPNRFIASAIFTVQYLYKSWFALQKRRYSQKVGKERYLRVLERDAELQTTNLTHESICVRAQEILEQAQAAIAAEQAKKSAVGRTLKKGNSKPKSLTVKQKQQNLWNQLFKFYDKTDNPLTQQAIAHLLKNELQVNPELPQPDDLTVRIERKKIEIARLEKQLHSRLPKKRDPTGVLVVQFIEQARCLPNAAESLSEEACLAEWVAWKESEPKRLAKLATLPNCVPYPIRFESSDDLYWSLLPKGKQEDVAAMEEKSGQTKSATRRPPKHKRRKRRKIHYLASICVRFRGLSEHSFRVQCSHRQLPVFQQCLDEWQLFNALPNDAKFGLGLFPLRSARLVWRKDNQAAKHSKNPKAEWNQYRLYLHCSIDRRTLTAEGTEQLRQQKLIEARKQQKGGKHEKTKTA